MKKRHNGRSQLPGRIPWSAMQTMFEKRKGTGNGVFEDQMLAEHMKKATEVPLRAQTSKKASKK